MPDYIGAIDQGTTSTRFIVFDRAGRIVAVAQKEHEQIYPQPGWVEHDPNEIWRRTQEVIAEAMAQRGLRPQRPRRHRHHQPARNHRRLGPPHRRAGGQRARLAGYARRRRRRGMSREWRPRPLPRARPASRSPPISAPQNPLDSRPRPRRARAAEAGDLLFGNIDTFLVWHLTGGLHVTDCTNASRTQLMNLRHARLGRRAARRLPHSARRCCPRIRSSQRGLRRGHARRHRRRADRRHPRRSAGGARRPDLLPRRARPRTRTAPDVSC